MKMNRRSYYRPDCMCGRRWSIKRTFNAKAPSRTSPQRLQPPDVDPPTSDTSVNVGQRREADPVSSRLRRKPNVHTTPRSLLAIQKQWWQSGVCSVIISRTFDVSEV